MHIIRNLSDLRDLTKRHAVSEPLAKHLEKKMKALQRALEPDTELEIFSLDEHGPFGLLEKGDRNLTAIGLPESLAEIMPEWVSRLEVAGEIYYVLYVMADNDYVIQVYLPDAIVEETIRLWLSEQPVEEEGDGKGDAFQAVPY